jgi:DNA-binding IclR family transcriptional regulator
MMRLDNEPAYRAAVQRVRTLATDIGFNVAISLPTPQGPTIVHYAPAGTSLHLNLHVGTVMALATTATGRAYCAFQPESHWQPIWTQQQTPATASTLPAFRNTCRRPRTRHGAQHRFAEPGREQSGDAIARRRRHAATGADRHRLHRGDRRRVGWPGGQRATCCDRRYRPRDEGR